MKKTALLSLALLAAALSLTACKEAPAPAAAPATAGGPTVKPGAAPLSFEAIAADAKGFTLGSAMSVRTVYVFFDAQCPHCAALWAAAKPLKSQAKFVWIPVGILNPASTAQGAALLAAADPIAAMDEHEVLMRDKKGGITAVGNLDAQRELVKKNTELMNRFGFASIPTIVGKNASTGAMVVQEGSLATPALANLLGLSLPSGS